MDEASFIPILLAQLDGFEEGTNSIREFSEEELHELLLVEQYEVNDANWYSLMMSSHNMSARLVGFDSDRNWFLTMSNGESLHHIIANGAACLAAKKGFHFAAHTSNNRETFTVSKEGTILSLTRTDNGKIVYVFYKVDIDDSFGKKDLFVFNEDTHFSSFNGKILMQSDMPSILPKVQYYYEFYLGLIADETIARFMPSVISLEAHLIINARMASTQNTVCDFFEKQAGILFGLTVNQKMEVIDPSGGNDYFLVLNDVNQTFRVSRLDRNGNEIIDYIGHYCVLIICLIIGQFEVEDEHSRFDLIRNHYLEWLTKTKDNVEDHADE
ncbi:hypothetical protein F0Z19_3846 [Vibrio cyclitrophicus]|nr:hypothetical protein F0Z19_3846 [Vibrio cyclitrophicus]